MNLEVYRKRLLPKPQGLIKRHYERRSPIAMGHDSGDEGAPVLQNVIKDLAVTNMEREIRALTELELGLRLLKTRPIP